MAMKPVNKDTRAPITLTVMEWLQSLGTPEAAQWMEVWKNHTAGNEAPEFDPIWKAYEQANNIEMIPE